jgi:glycosyltransferase involved in cell wall biosynthesis
VAHLGAEHIVSRQAARSRECVAPSDFALFVGGREEYKNFLCVLDAVASKDWPLSTKLLVVGRAFSEHENRLLKRLGIDEKVISCGKVDDSQLSLLYRRARCFVFSSLDEGFGIPVIECQSSGGVPVLSDIPVFREVAGRGAMYFDPHSPADLCRVVQDAVNVVRRENVLDAASLNVGKYSWDSTAQNIVDSYASVFAG